MEDKNFSDLGRQINDAVQQAIQTGNFSQLKWTLGDTLHTVVDKTLGQNQQKSGPRVPPQPGFRPPVPPAAPQTPYVYSGSPQPSAAELVKRAGQKGLSMLGKKSKLPKLSAGPGIAMQIVGFIGLALTGIANLVLSLVLLFGSFEATGLVISLGILVPLMLGFLFLGLKGVQSYARAARHRQYMNLSKEKQFFEVKKLAALVRKSPQFLVDELNMMMLNGLLPNVHINDQQTFLFFGDEVYRQYLEAQRSLRQRETVEQKKIENPDGIEAVVSFGRECIRQMRQANDALTGKEISEKLDRLEEVATRIFACVEKHPQKLPEIRKFMDYYLPTTLKLLNSYQEFDAQPVQGENIITAKKEIEDILDTINTAFLTLLDSLYQDDAMDISTDIYALKAMLAQEGLTESDFKRGASDSDSSNPFAGL